MLFCLHRLPRSLRCFELSALGRRCPRPRADPHVFLRAQFHVLSVVCWLLHQHRGSALGEGQSRAAIVLGGLLRPPGVYLPPKLWSLLDSQQVTSEHSRLSRSCHRCVASCLVVSRHISTQTRTYLLTGRHVWWSVRSPRACAVLQQARLAPRPRSPLATVRRRGLVVRSCPSCSLRAALSSSSSTTALCTPWLKVLEQ